MLSAHQIRQVAVSAYADPKTVRKFLTGERVQPSSAERIAEAIRSLGLESLSLGTMQNDLLARLDERVADLEAERARRTAGLMSDDIPSEIA